MADRDKIAMKTPNMADTRQVRKRVTGCKTIIP